jgi:hypothetical protein
VQWGKCAADFKTTEHGVSVSFTDGTSASGSLLVGADSSGSKIRQLLLGDEAGKLKQLPARLLAVTVRLPEEKAKPLRDIDPVMFQGSHPDTGYYLWFSTLSTPGVNGSSETGSPYYEGQVCMSWLIKGVEDEVPPTNEERLARMKTMARAGTGFQTMLRETIEGVPKGTEVLEIKLADWPTVKWPSFDGRVTLLGDAAHAMTMCKCPEYSIGFRYAC